MEILGDLADREIAGISLGEFLTFTSSMPQEAMEKLRDPAGFAD